jgi:hypothetical protein
VGTGVYAVARRRPDAAGPLINHETPQGKGKKRAAPPGPGRGGGGGLGSSAPCPEAGRQPPFTWTLRVSVLTSSVLGRVTVSTPFLKVASALSVTTSRGRGTVRVKEPK